MKKTLLLITLAFVTLLTQAQIPNAGFENWTDDEPNDYFTLNLLLALSGKSSVSKTEDKHSGSSAIKLETVEFTNVFLSELDTLPGFAFLGETEKGVAGKPFTSRPTSFSGFYKTNFTKLDTAFIAVALYKWNAQKKDQDSIGGALFATSTNVSNYASFTVPFIYTSSTENPDTMVVFLASSGGNPIPGSTLFVDDLSISGITGTRTSLFANYTPAFPNPAREQLHLNNIPSSAAVVEIRDITGKLIEVIAVKENVEINTNNYTPGLYQYAVKTEKNNVLYNDKFSVVK